MMTHQKRTEERSFLERFFEFRPDLLLPWRDGPDPPDFELGNNYEVSLEVTRLSHQEDMAHRAEIQRFEKEAEEALGFAGARCVFSIFYREDRTVLRDRSNRSQAVRDFVRLIQERIHRSDHSHIYPAELHDAGIDWIRSIIFEPAERTAFTQSRYAVGKYDQRVVDAVRRKSKTVVNYPAGLSYAQCWLLLVSHAHLSEPCVADIPLDAAIGAPFDRTFFLDLREKTATELVCSRTS